MATALVAAGCGGSDGRESIDGFIRDANDVQERSAAQFEQANRTYVDFSKGDLAADVAQRRLSAAEEAMRRTRDDIAALEAPQEAKRLQRLLVALYDADATLARESTLLAEYVPASSEATRPLARIGRALTRGLRSADTAERQVSALRRYARGVGAVVADLQPLQPPPLLIDRHHEQVQHLGRVRSLALRLVGALEKKDSQAVAKLLLRFRRLSGRSASGPLPASALDAYNERYLGVRKALQAVEREQARLEKEL